MKRTTKILFTTLSTLATLIVLGGMAFAQGAETEAVRAQGLASNYGLIALAAGLGIASPPSAVASARVALRPPRSTVSPATRAPLVRSAAR